MSPDNTRQPPDRGWNYLALPNDDPRKIVAVALTLCLVCAVLVSATAVLLKPLQDRNQALAIKREIISVAGLAAPGADTEQLFRERISMHIVELDSGAVVDGIDPQRFDARAAARDPANSRQLSRDTDIAGIKRRARHAPVYLVQENGRLATIILPIHGYGLWSTMYGFLALAADARTITGITFYEHGETPGLGDAIVDPDWQAGFRDKLAYDDKGTPRITVIKGRVNRDAMEARYQVDGISGATLTGNGVARLLRFWLGDLGFGPYLEQLRATGGTT
ncbi:MAG: Na(+)-translocating NADH-quinone reductase subunit C [Gammaproteobacteria bacterium]|nr:Na(+)-translocating NADH-quinone reductase subunit C [Gammaproteobacteria bacterium]